MVSKIFIKSYSVFIADNTLVFEETDDGEALFARGFFTLIVSEENLTEDLEQFESESFVSDFPSIFRNPFFTGPFLMYPLPD